MVNFCWRKSSLALFLSIISAACGAAPQSPQRTDLTNPAAARSSNLTADINRNIAAAAMFGTSTASSDYKVGPEDLLEITIFNIPEAEGKVTPRSLTARVSQQGQISLPLLGELSVKGLSIPGIEQRLRQGYDRYIFNPQVGVSIKEFRQKASVIGAVQKAGVFEITGPKTVIEMLALAGGVNEKAGSQVHIYRQGLNGRDTHIIDLAILANSVGLISADNAAMINMSVEAGDVINIPEAGMFFVDGAVRKPGSYPLGRRYSLAQALATAGGVDAELNSDTINIFRRQGPGEVQTIAFNLSDVLSGTVSDPQIQPDDVILVPNSMAKFIVKRFIGQLVSGISIGSFFVGY
jgi:polysaccharide export outer membrane protein